MILREEKLNLVAAVHQNLVFHLVTVFCVTQGKTVNLKYKFQLEYIDFLYCLWSISEDCTNFGKKYISIFSVACQIWDTFHDLVFFCWIRVIADPGSYTSCLTMLLLLCIDTYTFVCIVSCFNYLSNPEQ